MGTRLWILAFLITQQGMGAPRGTITVQLYNLAQVPERDLHSALDEAGWILRRAGIEVQWMNCGTSLRDGLNLPGCAPATERGLFVISMLRDDPREEPSGDPLGFAVLAGAKHGAAVIYPRVVALISENPQCEISTVLGNVIAHELGHLLSGSPRHGNGIMRSNWGAAEFERMNQRRLTFSSSQAEKLRTMVPEQRTAVAFSGQWRGRIR